LTTSDNNTTFQDKFPPITVGDRVASLYTRIRSTMLTSDKQNTFVQGQTD